MDVRVWRGIRATVLVWLCTAACSRSSAGPQGDAASGAAVRAGANSASPAQGSGPGERSGTPAAAGEAAGVGARDSSSDALAEVRRAAADRIVAIGDLHGDVDATRRALRLAGVLDAADHWSGGTTVVVQTGDQLDRGDHEREILELLARLEDEAARAGGAMVVLNGNHEIMNALGDFRYVTEGGAHDFDGEVAGAVARADAAPELRGRAAAFAPGGPWARRLAQRHIVAIVGDTAFVHGGILPEHVPALGRLDQDVRALLRGELADPSATVAAIMDPEAPLWTREFSLAEAPGTCERLGRALQGLGVARLVVGHTVQKQGINAGCNERVWRIDVGLAAHYGGPTEVLEIRGASVSTLRSP